MLVVAVVPWPKFLPNWGALLLAAAAPPVLQRGRDTLLADTSTRRGAKQSGHRWSSAVKSLPVAKKCVHVHQRGFSLHNLTASQASGGDCWCWWRPAGAWAAHRRLQTLSWDYAFTRSEILSYSPFSLSWQNRGSMGSMNNDLLYSKIEYLSLAPSTWGSSQKPGPWLEKCEAWAGLGWAGLGWLGWRPWWWSL